MKAILVLMLAVTLPSAHAKDREARDCRAEGRQAYQEALEGDPSCQEDKRSAECSEAAAAARDEAVRACQSGG
jgi:hypothetical protein